MIMGLFTGTLLADLSAEEVCDRLAGQGLVLDADTVESRCRQLVIWGNFARSVRETRVPTVAAYIAGAGRGASVGQSSGGRGVDRVST
jgi:hypothetical protein